MPKLASSILFFCLIANFDVAMAQSPNLSKKIPTNLAQGGLITKNGKSISIEQIQIERAKLFSPRSSNPTPRNNIRVKVQKPQTSTNLLRAIELSASDRGKINYKYNDANYCQTHPPIITNISGKITQGSEILIKGFCFRNSMGKVALISDTYRGNYSNLEILSWKNHQIKAKIDANVIVPRRATQNLNLTTSDNLQAKMVNVYFEPTFQDFDVTNRIRHSNKIISNDGNSLVQIRDNDTENGTDIQEIWDTGFAVFKPLKIATKTTAGNGDFVDYYEISVNPECFLKDLNVQNYIGFIDSASGVGPNPSNEAKIKVHARTDDTLYEHWYGDDVKRQSHYEIFINAACPLGIHP